MSTPATALQPTTRTARVRASSARSRRPLSPEEAAVTTTEIPLAEGAPAGAATLAARRSPPGRSRPRREPAPVALRFFVWLVLFLCVIGAAGLVVEHTRPDWLSSLRHSDKVRPAVVTSGGQTDTTALTTDTITPVGNASSTTNYSVPTSSYTLVVTITARCYVVLHTPATSSSISFASVLTPQMSPKRFSVQGSSSITLDAQAVSLSVTSGTKTLGTISRPKLGVAYTFEPKTT